MPKKPSERMAELEGIVSSKMVKDTNDPTGVKGVCYDLLNMITATWMYLDEQSEGRDEKD